MFLPSTLHSAIWHYDGGILVISNLSNFPYVLQWKFTVFSNRVLPARQDEQPSPVVIGCAALEASRASLINTL